MGRPDSCSYQPGRLKATRISGAVGWDKPPGSISGRISAALQLCRLSACPQRRGATSPRAPPEHHIPSPTQLRALPECQEPGTVPTGRPLPCAVLWPWHAAAPSPPPVTTAPRSPCSSGGCPIQPGPQKARGGAGQSPPGSRGRVSVPPSTRYLAAVPPASRSPKAALVPVLHGRLGTGW